MNCSIQSEIEKFVVTVYNHKKFVLLSVQLNSHKSERFSKLVYDIYAYSDLVLLFG